MIIKAKWQKAPGIASNQFAIWIEDENGNHVKTLFVTKFTVKKGYKSRPDALSNWIKLFKIQEKEKKVVDSITNATPKSDKEIEIIWNLEDEKGEKVSPGKYFYKAESTLYWKEVSINKGVIIIGENKNSSDAVIEYFPADTDKKNRGIINLSAIYEP